MIEATQSAHVAKYFVHAEDQAATCEAARQLWMGLDVHSFENSCLAKEGRYRWPLWNATAVVDKELISAAAVDITDIKEREQALKESAERVRALVQRVGG